MSQIAFVRRHLQGEDHTRQPVLDARRTRQVQTKRRLTDRRTRRDDDQLPGVQPVEGGTRIRETWDVSTEALPTRFLLKPLLAEHTRESMERTLARIEELLRD